MRSITHQKHLVLQSGDSVQNAVEIFKTLRVFTKEAISEQEIKPQCKLINDKAKLEDTSITHCLVESNHDKSLFVIIIRNDNSNNYDNNNT